MDDKYLIITNPFERWIACPCVWEATSANGYRVYIYFRYGKLDVLVNDQVWFSKQIGEPYDGYINFKNICREAKLAVVY